MMKYLLALFLGVSSLVMAQEMTEVQVGDKTIQCYPRWFGNTVTLGGRCRFQDEVMVGIRSVNPLQVECSRLTIVCNDKQTESPVRTDGW